MQRRLFERARRLGGDADDATLRRGACRRSTSRSAATWRAPARLFARALETPGGLKIQTIHAFCEKLLQRFPLEAGVSPRFRVLEDDRSAAEVGPGARPAGARWRSTAEPSRSAAPTRTSPSSSTSAASTRCSPTSRPAARDQGLRRRLRRTRALAPTSGRRCGFSGPVDGGRARGRGRGRDRLGRLAARRRGAGREQARGRPRAAASAWRRSMRPRAFADGLGAVRDQGRRSRARTSGDPGGRSRRRRAWLAGEQARLRG